MADDPEDATAAAHPPGSDEAILAELRERFDYATTQKAKIVEEGDIDVRFAAGDTWNAEDRSARKGRPVENYDQLSQYLNQLVNSYRQNPRGIKVSPGGGGATDKSAELVSNRVRQIEYDSHAQEVYTVAGENAATRGYGYARLATEYEDSGSPNQVLRLKAIPNPNQVIEDPDAESTSGADWQYLFFVHTVTKREFKRDYPDATIKDFDGATMALAPRWFGKDGRVQIAEYWYVTETPSAAGRPTRTVCMYLTNGVELLAKKGYPKKTEWRGTSIPFIAFYGKIVYQTDDTGDSQKMLQSYFRLARSAAKSYNWTKSTELEALGLPVKAALFAYEGQLDQEQVDNVERSTREPVALITAKATIEGLPANTVLPLPQYGTRAPDIQGYEIAAESFRRDVQNALGRYSAGESRLGSTKVTSGVALRELDKSGDLGSYHFVAHYDDGIREAGVKLVELLPFYDDTDKEIATRLPDNTTKLVRVNHMTGRDDLGNAAYAPDDLRMDQGRHTVTISTGPSFDSQREAGKEAAMTLLGNPLAFPLIASDSVRLMDLGPIGDQMADDLEFLQPPEMRAAKQQKDGGEPNPQQLQQELMQLKHQLKELEQVAQQMDQELKTKQAEQQAKTQIAAAELQSKDQNAEADRQQEASQAQAEQQLKLEIEQAKLEIAARELALKEAELALQREELEVKVAMQAAALESAEKIATLNAQVKVDAARQAARKTMVRKTIDRSPDGAIMGSHEEHEDVGAPADEGAPA